MRCARCNVEVRRQDGYVEIRITANSDGGGRHVTTCFCTFFCAAVAMDLMSLQAIERVPEVHTLPQAQNWIGEHQFE